MGSIAEPWACREKDQIMERRCIVANIAANSLHLSIEGRWKARAFKTSSVVEWGAQCPAAYDRAKESAYAVKATTALNADLFCTGGHRVAGYLLLLPHQLSAATHEARLEPTEEAPQAARAALWRETDPAAPREAAPPVNGVFQHTRN